MPQLLAGLHRSEGWHMTPPNVIQCFKQIRRRSNQDQMVRFHGPPTRSTRRTRDLHNSAMLGPSHPDPYGFILSISPTTQYCPSPASFKLQAVKSVTGLSPLYAPFDEWNDPYAYEIMRNLIWASACVAELATGIPGLGVVLGQGRDAAAQSPNEVREEPRHAGDAF